VVDLYGFILSQIQLFAKSHDETSYFTFCCQIKCNSTIHGVAVNLTLNNCESPQITIYIDI
jgi:hypothetical protein